MRESVSRVVGTSGMTGSQSKMILSEPLYEKTYLLPCLSRAASKNQMRDSWGPCPAVTVLAENLKYFL